jgi:hypothetical protein
MTTNTTTTYDFSRSYFRFRVDLLTQPAITLSHKMPTTENNVRINLESRLSITNKTTGVSRVYALGASCKTERVGSDKDLWLLPNGNFQPVVSDHDFLIIKSWARKNMGVMRNPASLGPQPERQVGLVKEAWATSSITFREVPARILATTADIIDGIKADLPLVSHTEYHTGDWHVVIDHPVKTINYSQRENVFQTDTGPLLLPDLSPQRIAKEESLAGCLDLAYSAINHPNWVEFIINAPTPLSPDISVNHYSKPLRIDNVTNQIFQLAD